MGPSAATACIGQGGSVRPGGMRLGIVNHGVNLLETPLLSKARPDRLVLGASVGDLDQAIQPVCASFVYQFPEPAHAVEHF